MTWTGTPLRSAARARPALRRGRRAAVHRRRPRGRARRRAGLRAVAVGGGPGARRRAARVGLQRRRPPAAARLPAAAARARLVRHGLGQVAAPDRGGRRAVRRLPDAGVQHAAAARGRRRAADPHRAAGPRGPARLPGLHVPPPRPASRAVAARGPRVVGLGRRHLGRGDRRRRSDLAGRRAGPAGRPVGLAALDAAVGRHGSRARTPCRRGPPTRPVAPSPRRRRGTAAASPTPRSSRSRSPSSRRPRWTLSLSSPPRGSRLKISLQVGQTGKRFGSRPGTQTFPHSAITGSPDSADSRIFSFCT